MYCLLSSTRYDEFLLNLDWNNDFDGPSPFFLLPYRHERLIEAARQHGWDKAKQSFPYDKLKKRCIEEIKRVELFQAVKIRITLSEKGELSLTLSAVSPFASDPTLSVRFNPTTDPPPAEGSIITVYLDHRITPSSLFTRTKTTNRALYDEARAHANITSPASEVMLFNEDSLTTEASISNVHFFRDGRWLTPSASTGCLPGVMRKWLLERKFVYEDENRQLTRESIVEGEWVLLSNGVQGCRLGRIARFSH
ncbi:hypothetical protein GYMLUDRAFT_32674 [Collybiopsis luxurians FD-317 M1]|nr:hypothetical protein GYMLUDRAFT_32674 [Collybiopsis luxurians FD-317 M1]